MVINKPTIIIIALVIFYLLRPRKRKPLLEAKNVCYTFVTPSPPAQVFVQEVPAQEMPVQEMPVQVPVQVPAQEEPPFDLTKLSLGFPYRKFRDSNMNTLPIVGITGFFRDTEAKNKYYLLKKNNIMVVGVTAYKSFPQKILDEAEDKFHHTDDFDYKKELNHWLCCFNKKNTLLKNHNMIDISESDFYDNEETNAEKKYDFIYICNKDSDTCPMNGWNAINRNFDLALKCFPTMFLKYKMKGLIVGRVGCGLEEKYGDQVEVTDFLDYFTLQQKMRESKFLFVPNIYDASPRVVTECIVKGVPVLMNQNIICGFKYINDYTGELFSDENNFESALIRLMNRLPRMEPRKWWIENYGRSTTGKKLRNFLLEASKKDGLDDIYNQLKVVEEVHFVI